MKRLMTVLLAATGLVLSALDFQNYDAGRGLPADKVYPEGRIFPFAGFGAKNGESV